MDGIWGSMAFNSCVCVDVLIHSFKLTEHLTCVAYKDIHDAITLLKARSY